MGFRRVCLSRFVRQRVPLGRGCSPGDVRLQCLPHLEVRLEMFAFFVRIVVEGFTHWCSLRKGCSQGGVRLGMFAWGCSPGGSDLGLSTWKRSPGIIRPGVFSWEFSREGVRLWGVCLGVFAWKCSPRCVRVEAFAFPGGVHLWLFAYESSHGDVGLGLFPSFASFD